MPSLSLMHLTDRTRPCSEKLDVVRLTFYTAPIIRFCLALPTLYFEVGADGD